MSTFHDYRCDVYASKRRESLMAFKNFLRVQRRRLNLTLDRRVARIQAARVPTEVGDAMELVDRRR